MLEELLKELKVLTETKLFDYSSNCKFAFQYCIMTYHSMDENDDSSIIAIYDHWNKKRLEIRGRATIMVRIKGSKKGGSLYQMYIHEVGCHLEVSKLSKVRYTGLRSPPNCPPFHTFLIQCMIDPAKRIH